METVNHSFFRDMGVSLGRSVRHILRSKDTMMVVAIVLLPVAFLLLLVYALGNAIQALEEIFLTIIGTKAPIKQK